MLTARSVEDQPRDEGRLFCCRVFFSYIIAKANFTVSPSGVRRLRTPSRTFSIADALPLRRPLPLHPVPVARISRDVHPSVRRKLVHHACCPSRTAGFNLCSCRCARPPDPRGWLCGGVRRSPVLVRRRTARVSLNASRRARARRVPAAREVSPRARLFACTYGLLCRRLWVCVLVVSC